MGYFTIRVTGIGHFGGTRDGVAMKRLYTREDGKTYRGMGYICEACHVELDGAPETPDSHILTPTWPVKVICQLNGEVVKTVSER